MSNDNTKVKQLLDKCKNLTKEHIIQACEKYHDTLTKQNENDSYYIEYKNEHYQLNPTIRIANNEFLKNDYKLIPNRMNLTKEERLRVYTSRDYKEFYEQKFLKHNHFKLFIIILVAILMGCICLFYMW